MLDSVFNYVTFLPDLAPEAGGQAVRIFLTLDQPWVSSAGTKPNINQGVAPYFELSKLLDHSSLRGTVEFWSKTSPIDLDGRLGPPDHAIKNVLIVDVERVYSGRPMDAPATRVIEYRVYFADARERFIEPRGGRLSLGEINSDEGGELLYEPNSSLIEKCLAAMAIAHDPVPVKVDEAGRTSNLKWFGNHAPTELSKLLDRSLAIFCIKSDGRGAVHMIGDGDEPTIPPDQLLPELQLPGMDRRGKTVVFTSAPVAVRETLTIPDTIKGIGWTFIHQDATGQWIETNQPAAEVILRGETQELLVTAALTLLTGAAGASAVLRERLISQLFKYVLIKFNPISGSQLGADSNVLRQLFEGTDKSKRQDITVMAKIAVKSARGVWSNSTDFVALTPVTMTRTAVGIALAMDRPLIRVDADGVSDPMVHVDSIDSNDGTKLQIRLTIEPMVQRTPGKFTPEYFSIGFQRAAGGIVELAPDELQNAIDGAGSDTLFVSRPEMRLLRVDGQEVNAAELKSQAKALAPRYLSSTNEPYRISTATGFISAEVSGRISEIAWDQQSLTTTIKINNWWSPSAGRIDPALLRDGPSFPKQAETQASKIADGAQGGVQPAVPIGIGGAGQSSSARSLEFGAVTEIAECGNSVILQPENTTEQKDRVAVSLLHPYGNQVPKKNFNVGDTLIFIRYTADTGVAVGPDVGDMGTVDDGSQLTLSTSFSHLLNRHGLDRRRDFFAASAVSLGCATPSLIVTEWAGLEAIVKNFVYEGMRRIAFATPSPGLLGDSLTAVDFGLSYYDAAFNRLVVMGTVPKCCDPPSPPPPPPPPDGTKHCHAVFQSRWYCPTKTATDWQLVGVECLEVGTPAAGLKKLNDFGSQCLYQRMIDLGTPCGAGVDCIVPADLPRPALLTAEDVKDCCKDDPSSPPSPPPPSPPAPPGPAPCVLPATGLASSYSVATGGVDLSACGHPDDFEGIAQTTQTTWDGVITRDGDVWHIGGPDWSAMFPSGVASSGWAMGFSAYEAAPASVILNTDLCRWEYRESYLGVAALGEFEALYVKTTGNTPAGTYTLLGATYPCSVFPPTRTIA